MSPHELPIIDYDNIPVGSLQHRIRSLPADEIKLLLDHERTHNNRAQVCEILQNRLNELRAGARPSGGSQDDEPLEAEDTAGGSPVDPSGSPEPMHPPRHGMAGQPGKPKGDRPRGQ
ncbi:hypothetical protein SAMN02982929_01782 [Saccharopolyspora kobensis]|uniref:DUF8129 domain-containing protein n=1 Tax=Saccharopolyspora kobensis TaxID=146035 RepID=A0A1H5ZFS4_9PSEU|nr:hypothetical protein [Saccharopolyspora kobensis]SEG34595.1 hypothetical protein SAMN02982929_01782 [Saccharopolyspora kobensis]SFF17509.1 hypothetical protein SAMN05216506_12141 [Saccharopolyspora kobensis]